MKITSINKLPEFLKNLRKDVSEIDGIVKNLSFRVGELEEKLKIESELSSKTSKQLGMRNAEIEHMISQIAAKNTESSTKQIAANEDGLFAENHLLDAFYLEFENTFRGSEEEIAKKQSVYLPYYKNTDVDYNKHPAIDIGSGRGEFIKMLEKNKINAIGVDLNASMAKTANDKGLKTIHADAIQYLREAKSESIGSISGFHLAEHIPFDVLITLISEAYRCLAPGGFLLLETPNPESVYVGAFTFHYDPSHLKPIPPAIMEFTAKFKGFEKVNILRQQPEITEKDIVKATKDKTQQEVLRRLFGPRDYALLAYK